MLDQLRRHSRSWITLFIFGLLILVFGLFYGFNDLPGQLPRSTVASVNGDPITAGEFEFAFDNREAYYRKLFQDKMPEQSRNNIRYETLNQLVTERLLMTFVQQYGLTVSDAELAAKIRAIPDLKTEQGSFDPLLYQQNLQRIWQKYHVNLERVLRHDLLLDRVHDLMEASAYTSADESKAAYWREQTKFTFEVVRIDPNKLVAAKKIAAVEDAARVATEMQTGWGDEAARKKLLAEYGFEATKIGPVSVAEHMRVLGPKATAADHIALFRLTPESPLCPAPVHVEQQFVLCRLLQRTEPDTAKWEQAQTDYRTQYRSRQANARMNRLLAALRQEADIEQSPTLFDTAP
ncbi:MAG: SurA N-terminal domain-containing protein [Deltaproteobacteria bacterium]|nr:SurA N-terminal domain-containing protein [Deltaproteobacteria bacterium]